MDSLIFGLVSLHFPARLSVEHVAKMLNTTTEGVYVLTLLRLLKPLGKPPRNGTKYYARDYILRLTRDEAWLARASDALVNHKWQKNHGPNGTTPKGEQ
jgi:hypothetical protein